MKRWAVVFTFCALLAASASAFAQPPGQGARTDIGGKQGAQAFSVHKRLIVWGAMGIDLDLIGNISNQGQGTIRGTRMQVNTTAYTDVYVTTPRRRYLGVGYGLFKKTEVFARYQDADNAASTVTIGQFGGATTSTFPVVFDHYKDRLIEFGLRKYMATPKAARKYFALVGGMKTVEPIGMNMQIPGGGVRAELYGKSRMFSMGVEVGITLEYRKVGIFIESGMRYQKRLTRTDDDLALYGLEDVNNTGIRIFMPVNAGLLIRF